MTNNYLGIIANGRKSVNNLFQAFELNSYYRIQEIRMTCFTSEVDVICKELTSSMLNRK